MKKVVIVGGGINGLVSANYLIKGGYDVTIIEKIKLIIIKKGDHLIPF